MADFSPLLSSCISKMWEKGSIHFASQLNILRVVVYNVEHNLWSVLLHWILYIQIKIFFSSTLFDPCYQDKGFNIKLHSSYKFGESTTKKDLA